MIPRRGSRKKIVPFNSRDEYPMEVRLHLRAGIQEFRRLLDVAPSRDAPDRLTGFRRGSDAEPDASTAFVTNLPYALPDAESKARARDNAGQAESSGQRVKGRGGRHPANCSCPRHHPPPGLAINKVERFGGILLRKSGDG